MINIEALRAGPAYENMDDQLPILSDEEARINLSKKIEDLASGLKRNIRLGKPYHDRRSLFGISSTEPSTLTDSDRGWTKAGQVEPERLQNLAFEVMSQYGFDPSVFYPKYSDGDWNNDGVSFNEKYGTAKQILMYPSQSIPGLIFSRELSYWSDNNAPIWVSWEVLDEGPEFKMDIGRAVRNRLTVTV